MRCSAPRPSSSRASAPGARVGSSRSRDPGRRPAPRDRRRRPARLTAPRPGQVVVGPVTRSRSGSMRVRSSVPSGRSGPARSGRHHVPGARQASARRLPLVDLHARQLRDLGRRPHEGRDPLGPEVGLLGQEPVEVADVEAGEVVDLEGDHHTIADRVVGDGVDGGRSGVRVAQHDRLHRPGREVLAVDAQPLVRASGEEEPAVGVAVRQVARPVDAVADLGRRRLLVAVVALERVTGCGVRRSRRWRPRR